MDEATTSSSTNVLKRTSNDSRNILSEISTTFKNETIKEILKLNFQDTKTKINEDTTQLVNEIMKLTVMDAILRASQIAQQDHKTTINPEHIEAIIPQLILDYP